MSWEPKFKQTEIGMIPEDWEVKEIQNVGEVIGGGTPSTKNKHYWDGKIAWITPKDLSNHKSRYVKNGERNITEEGLRQSSAKILPKGAVLLTTRAPVGYLAIAENEVTTNQGFHSIIPKENTTTLFLYYLLKRNVEYLKSNASGTTFGELSGSRLKSLKFSFPSLIEQQTIAKILSGFDSKVELNQRMIRSLEAVGQAVFKRWFVDFEFPNEEGKPYKSSGGEMVYNPDLDKEIPEGWNVKPIDEIANFLNGLALQKFPARDGEEYLPVVKIRELRQGITESSDRANLDLPEEYVVNDGDVLFSWSGSLEVVIWGFGKGALNQHLFKVTSSKYSKWFFYYWIVQYLPEYRQIAAGKATTMGHIQRHHLRASQVIVPDDKTLERMDRLLAPIFERIGRIKVETRILSELRDLLLPKLMSGKIRVPVARENEEAS